MFCASSSIEQPVPHTHKHTLKAGARSSRSWLDTGAGGDCSLFGQNPRCSAFVGNIYCLSSFHRHAMLNASVFLLQLAFPFSKKSELLPLLFAHPDLNRQICACTTLSISVSVGRKFRLFSTILPSKSLEARRTYMRYQSYNHTESYPLTTFTFSPLPFLRRVCVQLQVTWATARIQGLEHLLLPEATLGVGIVWCIVWCINFWHFWGICRILPYLLREHSTPSSEPISIAFLTNLCMSTGCTDTCPNRRWTIFAATVLISNYFFSIFTGFSLSFLLFTLLCFRISYSIYSGSKQRLSWILRCRSMLILSASWIVELLNRWGRFGPEPIIPDPQLQHLCYSHGQDLSILSPS